MKIVKLKIKNFRAIGSEGVSIDLENNNLVFLIGKNNAGKSSILAAYEIFVIAKKKVKKIVKITKIHLINLNLFSFPFPSSSLETHCQEALLRYFY